MRRDNLSVHETKAYDNALRQLGHLTVFEFRRVVRALRDDLDINEHAYREKIQSEMEELQALALDRYESSEIAKVLEIH